MFERIREVAHQLGMNPGALAALAREVSHDSALRDLEYMRQADAVELLAFLEARLFGVAA